MTIVVAQFCSDSIPYAKYTKEINKLYCEKHGYIYHIEENADKITQDKDRHPKWYKVKLIQEAFDKYNPDYVMYMDIDAMFSDHNQKIESFIDEKYELTFPKDQTKLILFSTSVFIAKNSPWVRKFCTNWWFMSNVEGGKYKTSAPYDKHCAIKAYNNLSTNQNKVNIVDNRQLNWHTFNDNSFILHAVSYEYLKNRKLDELYLKLTTDDQRTLEIDSLELLGETYLQKDDPDLYYFKNIYTPLLESKKETTNKVILLGVDNNGLSIWRSYFPNADIIVANREYNVKPTKKVSFIQTDVSRVSQVESLASKVSNVDFIIDCSKQGILDQQTVFGNLFNKLNAGGVYAIEGLDTSLRPVAPTFDSSIWSTNPENIQPIIYHTTIDMVRSLKGSIKSDMISTFNKILITETVNEFHIHQSSPTNVIATITKKLNDN